MELENAIENATDAIATAIADIKDISDTLINTISDKLTEASDDLLELDVEEIENNQKENVLVEALELYADPLNWSDGKWNPTIPSLREDPTEAAEKALKICI